MAVRRRRRQPNEEDELVQFMEHHLDEGMKEVLVYSRTNTDGPRRPRGSSDEVEVDLAGSHSRLALGTESPLRVFSENTVLLLAAYCRNSTTGEISNWKLWYLVVSEYLCMAGRGDIMVRGTRSQRVPYTHSR